MGYTSTQNHVDGHKMLTAMQNPILRDRVQAVDFATVDAPAVLVRPKRRDTVREMRDLKRKASAAEALAGFTRDVEIYGLTRGSFSMIDMIVALLDITGTADRLSLSTWTASRDDVREVCAFLRSGRVRALRFLTDQSFIRRSPAIAQAIRETFGPDAVRVGSIHAKWAIIQNARWQVFLDTSANLNTNMRVENFTAAHDPEKVAFVDAYLDRVWSAMSATIPSTWRPYNIITAHLAI